MTHNNIFVKLLLLIAERISDSNGDVEELADERDAPIFRVRPYIRFTC